MAQQLLVTSLSTTSKLELELNKLKQKVEELSLEVSSRIRARELIPIDRMANYNYSTEGSLPPPPRGTVRVPRVNKLEIISVVPGINGNLVSIGWEYDPSYINNISYFTIYAYGVTSNGRIEAIGEATSRESPISLTLSVQGRRMVYFKISVTLRSGLSNTIDDNPTTSISLSPPIVHAENNCLIFHTDQVTCGIVTLAGGTRTVTCPLIESTDRVLLWPITATAVTNAGFVSVPPANIVAGTNFTINSTNAADVSTYMWCLARLI